MWQRWFLFFTIHCPWCSTSRRMATVISGALRVSCSIHAASSACRTAVVFDQAHCGLSQRFDGKA